MSRNWFRMAPRRPNDLPHLRRIGEYDANPCQYDSIVAKSEDELTTLDLQNVLCYGACLEAFEEVVYYVPIAFERIASRPMEGFELVSPVLEFGAIAFETLRVRGWWPAYRWELWNCFIETINPSITIDHTCLSLDDIDLTLGGHVDVLSAILFDASKYDALRDMGEAMATHLVVVTPDLLWPRVSLGLSAFLDDLSSSVIVELILQTLPQVRQLEQHYREKAWRQWE